MAERRKFPSLDDPARFDAIVGRGRSLRRRRQLGVGAGAGGGVAAVALAVVMVTGSGGSADRLQRNIVADDDKVEAVETTTTTTTTAPPELPSEFVVDLTTEGDEITIELIDPAQPVADDSRQCVMVTLDGGAAGATEVWACDEAPPVDGVTTVDLPNTESTLVGCPAAINRDPAPIGDETRTKSTTFSMKVPADLAPGEYSVTVSATSGVGDGCAGTGDEAEPGAPAAPGAAEYEADDSTTITVG